MYENPRKKRKVGNDFDKPERPLKRVAQRPSSGYGSEEEEEDFQPEPEGSESEPEDSFWPGDIGSDDITVIENLIRPVVLRVGPVMQNLFSGLDDSLSLDQIIALLNSGIGDPGPSSPQLDQPDSESEPLSPEPVFGSDDDNVTMTRVDDQEEEEILAPVIISVNVPAEERRDIGIQTPGQSPDEVEYTIDPSYIGEIAQRLVDDAWEEFILALPNGPDIGRIGENEEIQSIRSAYLQDVGNYIFGLLNEEMDEGMWRPYA